MPYTHTHMCACARTHSCTHAHVRTRTHTYGIISGLTPCYIIINIIIIITIAIIIIIIVIITITSTFAGQTVLDSRDLAACELLLECLLQVLHGARQALFLARDAFEHLGAALEHPVLLGTQVRRELPHTPHPQTQPRHQAKRRHNQDNKQLVSVAIPAIAHTQNRNT